MSFWNIVSSVDAGSLERSFWQLERLAEAGTA